MPKLLRFLFSQLFITSFLLVMQISLIIYSLISLSYYFIYIDIILKAVSLIVVVIIINRHSNPMYKLAWLVPILLVPIVGGPLYLFICGQRRTKRFFGRIKSAERENAAASVQDSSIVNEINASFPHRGSTVKYINSETGLCAYRAADAQYYPVGEAMLSSLLSELEKAQRYIFMEYFIIKDGVMWQSILDVLKRKASEGVDVRIIYDGMGCMGLLPWKYPKTLALYNIKCSVFSPFTPFLSALQNNRDHRKITVIDGKTAFTGGINLSDEYINIGYKYGHWKDSAVMIKGRSAFSFTQMFLQMWSVCAKEAVSAADFLPDYEDNADDFSGYVMPYHDIPLDDTQTGKFIYLDIINKARKYVHIITPYLIPDQETVVALTNAARSGIDVKIICPLICDHWYARGVAYSYYKELIENGVKIYEYTPGFIHAKSFCSDDEVSVVGSINLDYRSLYLHFECAAWFLDSHIVASVSEDFNNTLKVSRRVTVDDLKEISPVKKLIYALLRLFAPLM